MSVKKKIRQEKVKNLILQGHSQREIAELLKVNQRTIERDVVDIKKTILNEVRSNPIEEVLGDFIVTQTFIKRQLWQMYRETGDYRSRLNTLKLMHSVNVEYVKICQIIGLITPQKIEETQDMKELDLAYRALMKYQKERQRKEDTLFRNKPTIGNDQNSGAGEPNKDSVSS